MSKRIIIFGAHPDDFISGGAGAALKIKDLGGVVKFVSMTNGDVGHPVRSGGEYAKYRMTCVEASAKESGFEMEVWSAHDCELMYSLELRIKVTETIRQFNADVIICPRKNDYHVDRRTAAQLVLDAAYLLRIPNFAATVPALEKDTLVLHSSDRFTDPRPFRADIVVDSTDVVRRIADMSDKHDTMMYEWDPWMRGELEQVSKLSREEKKEMEYNRNLKNHEAVADLYRKELIERYGEEKGSKIRCCEAFEISEYGMMPTKEQIAEIFPF